MDLRMAAPERHLRVSWAQNVGEWQPLEGDVVSFDGHSADVLIAASADVGAQIAHAVAAGEVTSLSVEPPSLGEVFTGSVAPPDPSTAPAEREAETPQEESFNTGEPS